MKISNITNHINNAGMLAMHLDESQIKKLVKSCNGNNIFFGAGIMTHKILSTATPFDILAFFFFAEQLRKTLNCKKVFVLVADQHAVTNQLFSLKKIQSLTTKTISIFNKIITNFSLTNFEIIQTIKLNQVQEIRDIFAKLPNFSNGYLKHEVADACWLQQFHNVQLKLGWSMSSENRVEGNDERFFDSSIKKHCPNMSFIHLKPGRTFDELRPRVSPYISVEGETRLLLNPKEDVSKKLQKVKQNCSPELFKATTRHLSKIIRLHDQLFEPLKFMSFEKKLQTILEQATV